MDKKKELLAAALESCVTFGDFEKHLANIADNKQKGDLFEYFSFYLLKCHYYYKDEFSKVYMHEDIPHTIYRQLGLPEIDKGLDLIAISKQGRFYGIQCKFRARKDHIIPWGRKLATFPALSFVCKIDKAVFITNCDQVCAELQQNDRVINVCGDFWETVTPEFIANLKIYLASGKMPVSKSLVPLDHQIDIINAGVSHLYEHEIGYLSQACGTGKTITSYFIIEHCGYQNIIFAVPSLYLLSQSFLEWNKQESFGAFKCILVGSDLSAEAKNVSGILLHTDQTVLEKWLDRTAGRPRAIFTTYQSADIVKAALNAREQCFDICVYDEAHHTTGVTGNHFSSLLEPDFAVFRKLFMTATPRIYKGERDDVYSMDNPDIYGECIYELQLGEAIDRDLLTPYQLVTPVTSTEQFNGYLQMKKMVLVDKKNYSSELIGAALLLLKCIKQGVKWDILNISKILTFHSRIDEAKKFAELINLWKGEAPIFCEFLDGSVSMSRRKKIIDEFTSSKIGILCSVRVLNEGVDIKCVDTVVFVAPKNSIIEITQMVCRCLRKFPGKKLSNVIIPMLVDSEDEQSGHSSLWNIVRALGETDEIIFESFKVGGSHGSGRIVNWNKCKGLTEKIPVKIDVAEWFTKIRVRIDQRANGWENTLETVCKFIDENERRPSTTSKNTNEKFLGKWIGNQQNNYKNMEKCMKLQSTRTQWEQFIEKYKQYLLNEEEIWEKNLKLLIEFIEHNNKRPSITSKDTNEKFLGQWINHQQNNYKNMAHSMKLQSTRTQWEQFIEKYKQYLLNAEEIWEKNLKLLIEFIEHNKKRPSNKSKNVDEKFLGIWFGNQQKYYKNMECGMKLQSKRTQWEQFIEKYKQYLLSVDEIWEKNLKLLIEFIEHNKKRPSNKSKNVDEKFLGQWFCTQQKYYKNMEHGMKLQSKRTQWEQFIEKYKQYLLNAEEIWQKNLKLLIEFIEHNKKRPSTTSKNTNEKFLGKWIDTQQNNYKNMENCMKLQSTRTQWEQFIEKYKQYLLNEEEIWRKI